MAASILPSQVRKELLEGLQVGLYVPNGYIDNYSANAVVLSKYYNNSLISGPYLANKDAMIGRPFAVSAADFVRPAGVVTVATGSIATVGNAYSDTTTTSEDLEIWYSGVRWDTDIIPELIKAQRDCFYASYYALSHLSEYDGDFSITGTANWQAQVSSTLAKVVSPSWALPYGSRGMSVVNSQVNDGAKMVTPFRLPLNSQIRVMTIAAVTAGKTAALRSLDGSTTPYGSVLLSQEESPTLMALDWQTWSYAREFSPMIGPSDASGTVYLDGIWAYKKDDYEIRLPSWATAPNRTFSIFQAIPRKTINQPTTAVQGVTSAGGKLYDAMSMEMIELEKGRDYTLRFHHSDISPYAIQFTKYFMDKTGYTWPLFLQGRRPVYDLGPIVAGVETAIPIEYEEFIPKAKEYVLRNVYMKRWSNDTKYSGMLQDVMKEKSKAEMDRVIEEVAQKEKYFPGVRRM